MKNIDCIKTVFDKTLLPNPASGTLNIGYATEMPYTTASISIVTIIAIYPISGQGSGSISFDGGSVAAGTYHYSLIIDGKTYDTKSMVIVKD